MLAHFHFKEVSSTQDKAFALIDQATALPFLVTTDIQTQGRGRQQREWKMEAGRSLAMSLAIQVNTSRLLGLTLISGLATRSALEIEELKIKWPNDLMHEDRKVTGILVESRSQGNNAYVVIGIGVNLFNLQTAAFTGIQKKVDPERIAEEILKNISLFERSGFIPFRESYEKVMWKKGETAKLKIEDSEILVTLKGVTEQGLLITDSEGILSMNDQGEIIHE